jgi:outer membrane protein
MKRTSLIINVVLAVAVIVLYLLYFTGTGKKSVSGNNLTNDAAGLVNSGNVYYVQIDTVISKFDMATDLLGQLETKYNSSDATLKARQQSFQKEVNDYQYKVQRQLLTRTDMATTEQQLNAKQQDLVQLQQNLSNDFAEQQAVMNRQVIEAIMQYLKENSTKYNYKYVLATTFGSTVLYANDSLDITKSVIAGLNENYKKEKESKK